MNEIPWDRAVELCLEIEKKNRNRWFTPNGMMCFFCARFSKDDMKKRCIGGGEDHRGCYQVNGRYDREVRSSS